MRYRTQRVIPASPSGGGVSVALRGRGLLLRTFDVRTPPGTHLVTYDGRGMGYESVLIDGVPAARVTSLLWFVPRFEFHVDGLPAVLQVRVWPWLAMRAVRLEIAGRVGYIEGRAITRRLDRALAAHDGLGQVVRND